jgi:DNA-binding PadR family transcriptional regulator
VDSDLYENLKLELRRGSLVVAVLAALRTEQYGYTLRGRLAEAGISIVESALYPMLRRLEGQGLLQSHWREENSRNKRFYLISPAGEEILVRLVEEWGELNQSIERILK